MAYIDTKGHVLVVAVLSLIALLLVAPVAALTWAVTTVDSTADVGKYSSLTLDKVGFPWISYYDATNGNLKLAFLNAGGWTIATPDNSANDVGQYSSLRIQSGLLDYITISYYDKTNGDLKLAYNSGFGWNTATVDTVRDVGRGTSIAVGSSPNPARISYYDTGGTLKYANYSYSSGTATLIPIGSSTMGAFGEVTSLVPDSSGNPRISYFGAAGGLQYASCDGVCSNPADWSTTTVDSNGLAGPYSSLALDSTGNPRIGYYDGTAGDLKYASCNGACTLPASWTITTVDNTGDVGWYTSLALDSTGSPRISYYDNTSHDLKYARGWITPVSNFTASPTSGPAPLTVSFTNTSTNTSTSWNWNFGSWSAADGGVSTLQNPSHTYPRAGNYTVSLDARNPDGGVPLNRVAYINVTDSSAPAVVSGFTALTTSGTAPLTVSFLDASTNTPISWNWNFGSWSAGDGGVSVLPNPSHTYTDAGTYTVSLNAQNANGGNTFIRTAYITVTAPGGGGGGGGSGSGSVPGSSTGTGSISTSDSDYPPVTPAVPTRTTDIYLKVNSEYLAEHKVTPADITIMSYGGSGWQPLPTSFVYSSGNNFYFKSDVDRYSVLAIGNRKDGISGLPVFATDRVLAEQPRVMASAVPVPAVYQAPAPQAVQQPASGPVARETSAVPALAAPDAGFPLAIVGLAAVGGVGLIGGGLLVRCWWIRRKNPALFREYD